MSLFSHRNDIDFSSAARVLIEAVPNLSTADASLVEELRRQFADNLKSPAGERRGWEWSGPGKADLLDIHFDRDHGRSVFTIAGDPPGVVDRLTLLAREALGGIDLRRHQGVHPRMGAIDVAPFVPLDQSDVGHRWAFWASRQFAEVLWCEFGIPSFLYGRSATRPDREELPGVRKPFERLAEAIAGGALPDVGDPVAHPRWGASAVGVRQLLVAFNVVLANSEIEPARRIAREIRRMRKQGELPGVRAMAFFLRSRDRAQVSMNLTEPAKAGVEAAFSAVLSLADLEGVGVEAAEVVGLAPEVALRGSSRKLLEFCPDLYQHSLEDRLRRSGLSPD